jgi:hypothetical protein
MRFLSVAGWAGLLWTAFACPAGAQVIEFESNGLTYQTATRAGLTIMFATLPTQVKDYVVLQVAVSNGSSSARTVRPEDFRFERNDGTVLGASPARDIVQRFLDRSGRSDVIKMVGTYEMGLYGIKRIQSTNGYEQRRQAAMAEMTSSRLKAAAAASAIVLIPTRLKPGESTDGAVFFVVSNHTLGEGKLVATVGVERFEFNLGGLEHPGALARRP